MHDSWYWERDGWGPTASVQPLFPLLPSMPLFTVTLKGKSPPLTDLLAARNGDADEDQFNA